MFQGRRQISSPLEEQVGIFLSSKQHPGHTFLPYQAKPTSEWCIQDCYKMYCIIVPHTPQLVHLTWHPTIIHPTLHATKQYACTVISCPLQNGTYLVRLMGHHLGSQHFPINVSITMYTSQKASIR